MEGGEWKTGYLSLGPCRLEYKFIHRPGTAWTVFLHGFGQDYRAFEPLYDGSHFPGSRLAIHLFFHGDTTLEGTQPLAPELWIELLERLFSKHEIDSADWVAFSMGAKFTLFTYQFRPAWFRSLTLLAPDGVVMNPWYRFATRTAFGRGSLRVFLRFFGLFRLLGDLLVFLRILPSSNQRFARSWLSHPNGRKKVEKVWIRLRGIWPQEDRWLENLRNRPIPFFIGLGAYDTIIPVKKFQSRKEAWTQVQWKILPAGHARLVEAYATFLESSGHLDPSGMNS